MVSAVACWLDRNRRRGCGVVRQWLLSCCGGVRAAEPFKKIALKVLILRLGRGFPGHSGLAGQNKLRNIGKGDGIAPGDAFTRELPDEIAEEKVHLIGGRKTIDVSEKLGGKDLRIHNGNGRLETRCVIGAERGTADSVRGAMMFVDQHVTTTALWADVLAVEVDGGAS
jgi:hypothetical protein